MLIKRSRRESLLPNLVTGDDEEEGSSHKKQNTGKTPDQCQVGNNFDTALGASSSQMANSKRKPQQQGSVPTPRKEKTRSWAFWSKTQLPRKPDPTDESPANARISAGERNEPMTTRVNGQHSANGEEDCKEIGELAVSGTETETEPVNARVSNEEEPLVPDSQLSASTDVPPPLERPATPAHQPPPSRPSYLSQTLVVPRLQDCLPFYEPNVPEKIQEKVDGIRDQLESKIKNVSAWQRIKAWWYAEETKPPPAPAPVPLEEEDEEDPGVVEEEEYVPPTPSDSFHPHYTQIHPHICRTTPRKIAKVAVIGVHGFFPMRAIRTLLGEPTGTSLKLSTEGGRAFERWGNAHGMTLQIERIALEGEGRVLDRVRDLYDLLMNWVQTIKDADCVFFAAHSQGTPVAIHLLARLIDDGHVDKTKRLGLLGIAGVSLGPFPTLFANPLLRAYSTVENPSLRELFQFRNPRSLMGARYLASLSTILKANTKVVYVGSVNDQVVPLYSSTCDHVAHPNIFRAAFINSAEVAPEFISDLVSLALLLKNIGSTDHGLLRELSSSLAGSLTGKGHSSIYDDAAVYDLALQFMLETTDYVAPRVPSCKVPLTVDRAFANPLKPAAAAAAQNPFVLPWALHGMFTEAASRPELRDHLVHLVTEFGLWAPETKALKDVKYRLGAVQSKL